MIMTEAPSIAALSRARANDHARDRAVPSRRLAPRATRARELAGQTLNAIDERTVGIVVQELARRLRGTISLPQRGERFDPEQARLGTERLPAELALIGIEQLQRLCGLPRAQRRARALQLRQLI